MFTAHGGGMSVEQSTQQPPPAEPVWGAPPSQPPAWSTRTTLAAVGIAAVLAAGGGLVIYAATSGSHNAGPGHMNGAPGWNGPAGGPGGPGAMGGPGDLPRSLHGEYVVPDGNGGFASELTQTGAVTAVSDTTIAVRSDDGYSRTYALDTNTRKPKQPLENGEQVTVRASAINGAAIATAVLPAR